MKKIVSLVLIMSMLLSVVMAMPVSADTAVFDSTIRAQTNEEGTSVAFLLEVNATGVDVVNGNILDASKAMVEHNGQRVKLKKIGVLATAIASVGQNLNQMVVGNPNVLDMNITRLYHLEKDFCRFAVRITGLSEQQRGIKIYIRPYYVVEVNGVEEIGYHNATQNTSVWEKQYPITLPELNSGIDVSKTDEKRRNRIRVDAASVSYRAEEGDVIPTINLTFRNTDRTYITEENSWVEYTCYDGNNKSIKTGKIYIGAIDTKENKVKSFSFDVPLATCSVALTRSYITYWTEWA